MGIRDQGRYAIFFEFNERAIPLKVTKYTTCDDVIEMILQNEGVATNPSLFNVVERTSGLERILPGRSLVLRVWRSWGCESSNFRFVIKRKDVKSNGGLQLKQFSEEARVDALFVKSYKTSSAKCVRLNKEKATCKQPKPVLHEVSASNKSTSFLEQDNSKTNLLSNTKDTPRNTKCASFLLSRFFNDLVKTTKRKSVKQAKKTKRSSGDGKENSVIDLGRYCDGSEDPDATLASTLHSRCQYLWDKYSMLDSDTDSESSGEFSCDESDLLDLTDGFYSNNEQLDKAFIKSSRDSDSDEGIDVTSVTSSDLDTAFVGDLELSGRVRSTREDVTHPSALASINKFEANISSDDYVRELFGCHGNDCEDDEMDSFMRSRLDSF